MDTWSGHWHAFGPWIGSGQEYAREGLRRPGAGPNDAQTIAFLADRRPPMMTGHWLMRKHQVAGTWTDVRDAVTWLEKHYADNPPARRDDGGQAYCSVDWRVECALDALPRGKDVTWGYWTQGTSLCSFSVVSCVNRHHPGLPCPLPPK